MEILVFGRPVMNWHAALLAVRPIDGVLRALEPSVVAARGHARSALQGRIATLRRLRRQVRIAYLDPRPERH